MIKKLINISLFLLILFGCVFQNSIPLSALTEDADKLDGYIVERFENGDLRYSTEINIENTISLTNLEDEKEGISYDIYQGKRSFAQPNYIYYTSAKDVYKYNLVDNTITQLDIVLPDYNRTDTYMQGNIFYIGTYAFEAVIITGVDVNTDTVVYEHTFNEEQAIGSSFVVDSDGYFYFSQDNYIVIYDHDGNQTAILTNKSEDTHISINQMSPNDKILFFDADYRYEGFVPIENNSFVDENFYLFYYGSGYRTPQWEFNEDGKYAVNQHGEIALFDYNSTSSSKRSYSLLYSLYLNNDSIYDIPAEFIGNNLYLGNDNGDLLLYDIETNKIVKNYSIGEEKDIGQIYAVNQTLYVIYTLSDDDYTHYITSVNMCDFKEPSVTNISCHHTLTRNIEEIRNKYIEMESKFDYENESIFDVLPSTSAPYEAGSLKNQVEIDILNQINYFRWLTGVNEISINRQYMDRSQKGAVIQAATNELTHFPIQPNDMDDDFYEEAYAGANAGYDYSGNVSWDYNIENLIQGYIDDTYNVMGGVGHRNSMLDIYGVSASFGLAKDTTNSSHYYNATSIYFDKTQTANDEYFYSWPASGYMPLEKIDSTALWSIALTDTYSYGETQVTLAYNGVDYEISDLYLDSSFNTLYYSLPDELSSLVSSNHKFNDGAEIIVKINNLRDNSGNITNVEYPVNFIYGKLIKAEAITLNKTFVDLKKNESTDLTVKFNPYNTNIKDITWTSSNPSVASVDENGKVTGLKAGEATITATTANGKTATCIVDVLAPISSVSLNKTQTVLEKGNSELLIATISPSDTTDDTTLAWYSSDSSIAKVENGYVTAISPGKVTITAITCNDKIAECTVEVISPIKEVVLNRTMATISIGKSLSLIATIDPNDTTNSKSLIWSSSNPSVATVNEGKVTAVGIGSTTITVKTSNGKTATCEVTVTEAKQVDGVYRIYGDNRYETAFMTANEFKATLGVSKFETAIVANGTNFADALAGSYLAAKKSAPILMTDKNAKNITNLVNYIKTNVKPGGTVYILGGYAALPNSIDKGLAGYEVKRLAGKDRYETNLLILEEAVVTSEAILVATGTGFADSLSASATGLPMLLVNKELNAKQKAFLEAHRNNTKYIVGGTSAVSAKVEQQVKAYGTVKRLAGNGRYDTSVLVAKEFFSNPTSAVVAYGRNFPDGLSGGPLAYAIGGPLLLAENKQVNTIANYTKSLGITNGYVLGGSGLVSDASVKTIFNTNAIK